ncbi:hypothetical protein F3Y22_tig00111708pilonHSYRG00228 [Hibiscus syriacus]|uniref:Uncharacterized protein n=1 Tax=Hibiscus syriacus TaxID=106335 RepID=A0A6A2XG56_HIBSY|nr:hypothetical protein F3Y22_tig00111708pilonHSYRG00228 [Hibiscus syriacus]
MFFDVLNLIPKSVLSNSDLKFPNQACTRVSPEQGSVRSDVIRSSNQSELRITRITRGCMVLRNLHIVVMKATGWRRYYCRLLNFVLRVSPYWCAEMSAQLCMSFLLSSALNIIEDTMDAKKQGIVSILLSDSDLPTTATSLRKKLSADMSSQKWPTQQGSMCALKKSPSSEEFSISSSFQEGEDDIKSTGQSDIWDSIQQNKSKEDEIRASCLSDKSLEICTESLGSETGSDGFSSDTDGAKDGIAKFNYDVCKKSQNTSFPPPIPSLSAKYGGAWRHLKTHRDNASRWLSGSGNKRQWLKNSGVMQCSAYAREAEESVARLDVDTLGLGFSWASSVLLVVVFIWAY